MNEWANVSVIVLNYNGKRFLEDCFSSLENLDYPGDKLEIILVDNNSSDGSAEYVKKNFPRVKIIENKENLGFSAGNNVAVRRADSKYICLLNPDTRVTRDWLKELIKLAEEDSKVGIVGSKVLFMRDPEIIHTTGIAICATGRLQERGFGEEDNNQYSEDREIFGASACAVLLRKDMLEEIGGFDEDFFAYCEDVDLAWRARWAGWKCVYAPKAIVYHWHSGIWGYGSPQQRYLVVRNRLWTIVKDWPLKYILFHFPLVVLFHILAAFWLLFKRGDYSYFTAFFDFLKGFPNALRERNRIVKKRGIRFSRFFLPLHKEMLLLWQRIRGKTKCALPW